jgi:hypothetical protein
LGALNGWFYANSEKDLGILRLEPINFFERCIWRNSPAANVALTSAKALYSTFASAADTFSKY